jgi:MFS family permease
MIISMPVGWMSDLYNLKHVMGIGMAIQIIMIALYAFAQNWIWILLAMILNPFTMAMMFRSQNLIVNNGLRDTDRAMGMGIRMMIAQFLGLISPIPAALLIEYFGGLSVDGIRPLYYIRLLGLTFLYGYIYRKLLDVEPRMKKGKVSFLKDFREVFKDKQGLIPWIIVGGFGSLVWSTMQTFTIIWCVDVKGANALTVGLMTTISTICSILFSIPNNNLADEKGRKVAFIRTRPALWIWILILVFAPQPSWLLVGWFFRGIGMSSLIRIPAPIIGAFLYESGVPSMTFLIPLIIDSLIRTPLLMLKVPETLKKV